VIIDSQSVKTNFDGEERGFHGGKKIKGRSRQVAVDTEGNLLCVHVHAANKADTVEACVLMKLAKPNLPRLKAVCADAGYRGTFETFMNEEFALPVHISEKIKDGFAVIPRRWVVERSFAWFNGQRRLSKDYERNCLVSESMIYVASISRLLRAGVN
jgi:putative transposase